MSSRSKPRIAYHPKEHPKWRHLRERGQAGLAIIRALLHIPPEEPKPIIGCSSVGFKLLSNLPNNALNAPVKEYIDSNPAKQTLITWHAQTLVKCIADNSSQGATTIFLKSMSMSSAEVTTSTAADLGLITSNEDPLALYNQLEFCDAGGFGKVYKGQAKNGTSGIPLVALKHISLEGDRLRPHLANEINILRNFCHPNIPRFVGAYLPNDKYLTIVTSFIKGANLLDVLDLISMDEAQIAFVCRELCNCLDYLHSNFIIHGDIRGLNIILTTEGEIRLVDFGAAIQLAAKNSSVYPDIFSYAWAAPEMLKGNKCGISADIWSLGITILEIFTRDVPFCDIWLPDEDSDQTNKGPPEFNSSETETWLKSFWLYSKKRGSNTE